MKIGRNFAGTLAIALAICGNAIFAGTLFAATAGTPSAPPAGTRFARPENHKIVAEIPPLTPIEKRGISRERLKLSPFARHSTTLLRENSGLTPCSLEKNLFWSINDGGNAPKIFAISAIDGSIRGNGVTLTARRNIDWECITRDPAGNLIIGDVGNNQSNRKNLVFYIVPEPTDLKIPFTEKSRKISFYYPTQNDFTPRKDGSFDCEACFAVDSDFIYFFSKDWRNPETTLWRVRTGTEDYQAAEPLVRFNSGGLVTDSAVSPNGKFLAILMYHGIWIFEIDGNAKTPRERFFSRPHFRRFFSGIRDWQTEGIAWLDNANLLISSESGALFRVPASEILFD